MCIKCHQGLSDEEVAKQLIDDGKYDGWNETSISHIMLAYLGTNGELAQSRAETLINNYIDWKRKNPKDGDGTFFGEPTAEFVETSKKGIDNLREKMAGKGITTSEQIKHALFSGEESKRRRWNFLW